MRATFTVDTRSGYVPSVNFTAESSAETTLEAIRDPPGKDAQRLRFIHLAPFGFLNARWFVRRKYSLPAEYSFRHTFTRPRSLEIALTRAVHGFQADIVSRCLAATAPCQKKSAACDWTTR